MLQNSFNLLFVCLDSLLNQSLFLVSQFFMFLSKLLSDSLYLFHQNFLKNLPFFSTPIVLLISFIHIICLFLFLMLFFFFWGHRMVLLVFRTLVSDSSTLYDHRHGFFFQESFLITTSNRLFTKISLLEGTSCANKMLALGIDVMSAFLGGAELTANHFEQKIENIRIQMKKLTQFYKWINFLFKQITQKKLIAIEQFQAIWDLEYLSEDHLILSFFDKLQIYYIHYQFEKMEEQQQNQQYQTSTHEEISINQINMKHHIECRICLQNAQDSTLPLISPCKCIGSVKYVHEECLEQWITKIVSNCQKKIGNGKAHILCQLCQTTINFETEKHLKCKSGEEMIEKIKSAKRNLILLILLMLVNLGFCLALLDYLIRFGFSNLMEKSVILVSLIISGQVILGIVAIISGCFVVKNYLLKSEIKVFRIKALSIYQPKGHRLTNRSQQQQ